MGCGSACATTKKLRQGNRFLAGKSQPSISTGSKAEQTAFQICIAVVAFPIVLCLLERRRGHVAQIHPNPAFRVSHRRNLHAHMAHGSGPWGVAFGSVFLPFQLFLCWLLTLPGVHGSPSLQPQALGRPVPEPWRGQPTPPAA